MLGLRYISFLLLMLSGQLRAIEQTDYCINNKLYGVISAVLSYTNIGITIRQNDRVVFPESEVPMELGWGKSWCRNAQAGETLVIHESGYFDGWQVRETLDAGYLSGIEINLEQAGRYDEYYGINLVAQPDDLTSIPSPASWMKDLFSVSDIPLNQICIPGSHDTGTYATSTFSGLDPYMDKPLKAVFDKVGDVIALPVKEVVKWWATTQGMNVYRQLNAGVRYLDIRARMMGGELVTAHGLLGASMAEIIADLKRFLSENPGELVIFHIQETHGMSRQDIETLYSLIEDHFSGDIAPETLKPSSAISEFQNKGYQLILVSDSGLNGFPNWLSRQVLSNPWMNKNQPYPLLKAVADQIPSRSNDQFHVAQMVLTPRDTDMKKMVLGAAPTSLRELNSTFRYRSGMAQYVHNAARQSGKRSNVILQDFPEDGDLYNNCMKENLRRLAL